MWQAEEKVPDKFRVNHAWVEYYFDGPFVRFLSSNEPCWKQRIKVSRKTSWVVELARDLLKKRIRLPWKCESGANVSTIGARQGDEALWRFPPELGADPPFRSILPGLYLSQLPRACGRRRLVSKALQREDLNILDFFSCYLLEHMKNFFHEFASSSKEN